MMDYSFIIVAVVAFVYSEMLTAPGMIFNRLFIQLDSLLPEYIHKPLIGCYKCVSGQMALWYFGLKYTFCNLTISLSGLFLIFDLIGFICLTIFTAWIIAKIHNHLEG
jgi:hypothetical protein